MPVGVEIRSLVVVPDAGQTPVPLSVLADRTITITNIAYVVGDTGVATWYNAGDFGNGNLANNDAQILSWCEPQET